MGCSDLNVLAPYLRIVMDRYKYKRRQLIFDVGANKGQDASMVLGVFQQVIGMCQSHGNSFKVVSIEPSPKVFCQLEELAQRRGWIPSESMRLNIALRLVPVHAVDWWYQHLNNFTGGWWGNGFCGIRNSPSLSMLYKAFHADNDFLMGAHDLVIERSTPLT